MREDIAFYNRSRPAHWALKDVFNRSNILFVTVCSKDRKNIFSRDEIHELLLNAWQYADFWVVGHYVIMPDHIHFFCAPSKDGICSLRKWMRCWKSFASRKWPYPDEQPIWQQDFWDRQLRKSENYLNKYNYVMANPVRAGLVDSIEDWPYKGEMAQLHWHD